jgi:hypothetical protein
VGVDSRPDLEDDEDDTAEALHCARHPQVETYLRCGRCGTPICPRCLVQTPVGARCPTCANVSKLPTFNVTPVFFARGMVAALVTGLVVGGLWALIRTQLLGPFGLGLFAAIFVGLGLGWALSEAVTLSANRKRGLGLQICASLGVVLAFLVYLALVDSPRGGGIDLGDLIAAGVGIIFAISRLKGY